MQPATTSTPTTSIKAIKLCFANVRALNNYQTTSLECLIEIHKPHIIGLVETWRKPNTPKLSLKHPIYEQFETNRQDRPGGGTMMLID